MVLRYSRFWRELGGNTSGIVHYPVTSQHGVKVWDSKRRHDEHMATTITNSRIENPAFPLLVIATSLLFGALSCRHVAARSWEYPKPLFLNRLPD